ncbi:MAG: FIST N-terminal domain-containing protein [Myxococcaceae bacterium]
MGTRISTVRSTASANTSAVFQQLAAGLSGEPPKLVMVFCSTDCPLEQLMAAAAKAMPGATALGCTTAGEFTEAGDTKGAYVAWALGGDDVNVTAGLGLGLKENAEAALMQAVKEPPEDKDRPHRTAILLLDPLSGNGEEAALIASTVLGPTVRLAGGAAGDDLKFARTLVACGNQVAHDAVVVAVIASKRPLGIGVNHGHKPLSRPLTVTRASGNVVHELDGRPAFEVWKDEVRSAAAANGVKIDDVAAKDIGAHLLRYELGMIAGPKDYKIRAPLSVGEGGAVSFACGIPEGAVVRVTSSAEADQITSARAAAERARKGLGGAKVAGALVFDCICRNLILGSKFADAVNEIHQGLGGAPVAGFETYGEIAMDLGQSSGFHNTTTVVLAFPA